MQAIKSFSDIRTRIQSIHQTRRLVVVHPHDKQTLDAVALAVNQNLITPILIGDPAIINAHPEINSMRLNIMTSLHAGEASALGVSLLKNNEADILMKGLLNTDVLLKAILCKTNGLVPFGQVVTFIAAIEIPSFPRLLFVTDPAVIPTPNVRQRKSMISYAITMAKQFGITKPKVALVHGTEKMNLNLPFMADYQEILAAHKRNEFGDAVVFGPLDLFLALDSAMGAIKNVESPIMGDADILIFPGFDAANIFYKSMMCFAHAQMGGVLFGTEKPVVLTSRSDSTDSKFNSIALACLL